MAKGTVGFRIDSRDTRLGAAQIEGLREVQKALRDVSSDLANEMKATHKEAAEIVVEGAKRYAPVRTGALAASIRAAATRTGGRVRVGAASVPYAGPVHFGWPARRIKPQPFVYEALDPRRDDIANLYAERISRIIVIHGIASDKSGNVYATKVG